MKFGFVLPYLDAVAAPQLAKAAEAAGWDAFFVWEPVWGTEAWVTLGAAAMVTSRIRLGTMLSPLSRMRPWKLAGETATVDQLSGGRVVLAVGLGAPDTGFAEFGEVVDRRERAELLDEGLDILTGLWAGQPFSHDGKHYRIRPTAFPASTMPVQRPRIPIWVVGAWPRPKSMRRVLRCDGVLPVTGDPERVGQRLDVGALPEMIAWIDERRTSSEPFDVVVEGATPADDPDAATATVRPWAEAGATWWNEAMWDRLPDDDPPERERLVRLRIDAGPPQV